MFLVIVHQTKFVHRFPRVRGDVPFLSLKPILRHLFSPRARGCSRPRRRYPRRKSVFPACAGMFRTSKSSKIRKGSFPRVRGDVPHISRRSRHGPAFSPRARGCSEEKNALVDGWIVFPACAGMFRVFRRLRLFRLGFPRVRGDVPTCELG